MTTVFRLAFWGCVGVVLYYALTPFPATEIPGQDKSAHILAFAALAFVGGLAWPRHMGTLALALLGFGCALELVQALTPSRVADIGDVVANVLGQSIGFAASRLWQLAALRPKGQG